MARRCALSVGFWLLMAFPVVASAQGLVPEPLLSGGSSLGRSGVLGGGVGYNLHSRTEPDRTK